MTDEEKKARNRERDRSRREANWEKQKEQARSRRAANREKKKEQARSRRAANREKVNEKARSHRVANREKLNEQARSRRASNPEREKDRHLKRHYGITTAERDALFQAQGNRCARCGTDKPGCKNGWHIDHCHDTEVVRGILCQRCNLILGMQGDNELAVFESALLSLRYLRKTVCEDDTAGVCAGLL